MRQTSHPQATWLTSMVHIDGRHRWSTSNIGSNIDGRHQRSMVDIDGRHRTSDRTSMVDIKDRWSTSNIGSNIGSNVDSVSKHRFCPLPRSILCDFGGQHHFHRMHSQCIYEYSSLCSERGRLGEEQILAGCRYRLAFLSASSLAGSRPIALCM